jgi:hypothetical protein
VTVLFGTRRSVVLPCGALFPHDVALMLRRLLRSARKLVTPQCGSEGWRSPTVSYHSSASGRSCCNHRGSTFIAEFSAWRAAAAFSRPDPVTFDHAMDNVRTTGVVGWRRRGLLMPAEAARYPRVSTPERKCIGVPEQRCIDDERREVPA